MKISINKKTIAESQELYEKGNELSEICPFALKLKRKFKQKVDVNINGIVKVGRKNRTYQISNAGLNFIDSFDSKYGSVNVKGGTFSVVPVKRNGNA